jgi:nucleotide-binding universal stress UspA family protein
VLVNREWLTARGQSRAYLEGASEAIAAANNIPVTAEIIPNISVENGLSSSCADSARLLILAKPARSSLSQFYSGSVTNSLVSRTTIPLLIIPTGSGERGLERTDFQRMLLCAGHGDVSESILSAGVAFAADGTGCELLHVFPVRDGTMTLGASRLRPVNRRQDALARLRRAESWLKGQKVNASSHIIDDWRHSPAEAILGNADELSVDLIVLGTRHRFLPWWLRGSLPEYITRHSKRPVLLVPLEKKLFTTSRTDHVDIHSN